MSDYDLTFPGDLANYRVGPRIEDDDGFLVPPQHPDNADFWTVYVRPTTGDIAEWAWIADFQHEIDAREFAARRAKES